MKARRLPERNCLHVDLHKFSAVLVNVEFSKSMELSSAGDLGGSANQGRI